MAAAAVTGLAVQATSARIDAVEEVPLDPSYHLFAVPIAVPPSLFAKRWILLNSEATAGCARAVAIDFETESGLVEHVWLKFRTTPGRSEWQRTRCWK